MERPLNAICALFFFPHHPPSRLNIMSDHPVLTRTRRQRDPVPLAKDQVVGGDLVRSMKRGMIVNPGREKRLNALCESL